MMKQLLEEQVNTVLLEQAPVGEINPQMALREDLGIDSLGLANLMFQMEEAFGIILDTSDLDPDRFKTVEDLYLLAEQYTAGN